MPAFISKKINPMELCLDAKNPRFILPKENASEEDIISYLCDFEDTIKLCNRLNNIGTILPGERIVVCEENSKLVVLEGNRRICSCKMLLDPSKIPENHKNDIKAITYETKESISIIEVDIVNSRETAKKYLAARHINGVKDWTTIAKMNFVVEEFGKGSSINNIAETTSLSLSEIRKYLRQSGLLKMGINAGKWTKYESERLRLTVIEPDKYLRIFQSGAKDILNIYFDEKFIPHSSVFSDEDLYTALSRFIRGAFLDNTIDTRNMSFKEPDGNLFILIRDIIEKYRTNEVKPIVNINIKDFTDSINEKAETRTNSFTTQGNTEKCEGSGIKQEKKNVMNRNLPLFGALDCRNINNNDPNNRGLLFITNEIIKFSNVMTNPKNYPIAAAILTRCLIENTMIYYLRQKGVYHNLLKGQDNNSNNIKLSDIIKYIIKNESNLFEKSTSDIKSRFIKLFKDYNETANPLNWVVHQLSAFKLSTETLQAMVDEGLFDVIQYMLLYSN